MKSLEDSIWRVFCLLYGKKLEINENWRMSPIGPFIITWHINDFDHLDDIGDEFTRLSC